MKMPEKKDVMKAIADVLDEGRDEFVIDVGFKLADMGFELPEPKEQIKSKKAQQEFYTERQKIENQITEIVEDILDELIGNLAADNNNEEGEETVSITCDVCGTGKSETEVGEVEEHPETDKKNSKVCFDCN
jgi:hypothetical protein